MSHSLRFFGRAVVALAVACGLCGAGLPQAAPESVGFSSERLARIDTYIEKEIATGRLPGASVLLMRHGKVVLSKVYGKADIDAGTPLEPDSLFRIYSQTKPVTGVALMILFEQGKWHFDDPITRFIPEFEQLRVFKGIGPDGASQTEPLSRSPTMRELVTHAAGFAYGLDQTSPLESLWHAADFMRAANTNEAIARIAALPMFDQPGRHWHYSAAADIQGYIVERLSGQSLADFMQAHIFGPLHMNDTAFYVPPQKMARLVGMKQIDAKQRKLVAPNTILNFDYSRPPGVASGGAGLVSTLQDYARFAQMLANGGELDGVRILSPASVKLMDSNQLADEIRAKEEPFGSVRTGVGFGIDVAVTLDTARAGTLGGVGSMGWGGAAGTNFWVDPSNDVVFVSMMQVLQKWDDPDLKNFDNDMTTLVYSSLVQPKK
ncbi:MAG TPA: serine hydrolase domain-containing protein [Steroidobacteraceae bacterium]